MSRVRVGIFLTRQPATRKPEHVTISRPTRVVGHMPRAKFLDPLKSTGMIKNVSG